VTKLQRRAHFIVTGRVQGVGFRYATHARAVSFGIRGWVRNRLDGSVEGVFEGPTEHVESLLGWCRHGPSGAYVDEIEIEWQEIREEKDFRIA
jgi:acylphosphatase